MGTNGHVRHVFLPSVVLIVIMIHGCVHAGAAAAPPAHGNDSGVEFFETAIRPVLVEHCYECHSDRAKEPEGEFRLDSREGVLKGGASGNPAIVAGNVAASPLIAAVRHADSRLRMPPKKKLRDDEIAALEAWVAMGAPDPRTTPSKSAKPSDSAARDFWSFRRPIGSSVPSGADASWARTPVDAFIFELLAAHNLKPSPEADRRTLIRRASFDLTGLPPTPEEVEQFIADTSADAYDRLVERLLASPRYGERWGR